MDMEQKRTSRSNPLQDSRRQTSRRRPEIIHFKWVTKKKGNTVKLLNGLYKKMMRKSVLIERSCVIRYTHRIFLCSPFRVLSVFFFLDRGGGCEQWKKREREDRMTNSFSCSADFSRFSLSLSLSSTKHTKGPLSIVFCVCVCCILLLYSPLKFCCDVPGELCALLLIGWLLESEGPALHHWTGGSRELS